MTVQRKNLRVPGPTPVPERVAEAGARPMVNHRGPEFGTTMREVAAGLQSFFGTQRDVLLLTGSGTGAQEAAIVNMLAPGDQVLSVTVGVFGDRFADIAEAFGASVHRQTGEWGQAADPASVAETAANLPNLRAVLLTHNETSTGVTNNVAALVEAIRRSAGDEVVVLVDGVSSIGALPFEMDAWDVDVAITGSQKAWMSPPGIAMVGISERGWEAYRRATMPRYYWDFGKARKNADQGTTPFTPAVGVVHALRQALRLMTEEGTDAVFDRHRRIGRMVREGMQGLGLELFAGAAVASNTVTAVRVPDGIGASTLLRDLRQRDLVLASGQDWLKGSIFRIGHMGWVHEDDVEHMLAALDASLKELRLKTAV